ncbi:MAG: isoprenylcysteine carboxylmethyltransferase family protein [Candidatus Omnitrophota bacterium]
MKKRLKINGVIIFVAFLSIATFPDFFLRYKRFGSRDAAAQLIGIALILLGQLFRVSARGFKSENSLNGRALIIGGPYTLVRNPMYLGIFLIGLGVVLVLFRWQVAGVFLLIFTLRYILLIFNEEKKLARIFPQEYPEYCSKVPRFFPSLKMLLKKDISEYLPLKLIWIKKEIGSILAVLLITLAADFWLYIKKGDLSAYLHELVWMAGVIIFFMFLAGYLKQADK